LEEMHARLGFGRVGQLFGSRAGLDSRLSGSRCRDGVFPLSMTRQLSAAPLNDLDPFFVYFFRWVWAALSMGTFSTTVSCRRICLLLKSSVPRFEPQPSVFRFISLGKQKQSFFLTRIVTHAGCSFTRERCRVYSSFRSVLSFLLLRPARTFSFPSS